MGAGLGTCFDLNLSTSHMDVAVTRLIDCNKSCPESELMDTEELKSLLEQHHKSSFGWALGCCRRDTADAEDVLQIVYLKVLDGRARFNGTASFKTWLFAVIRKTALDQRRKDIVRGLTMLRAAERGTRPSRTEHPDEFAYRGELQSMFRRVLARLPRRQREALELVFYHDLSLLEAASVMGVSLGSARTHYERGKKRLRQMLEETEELYESEWRRKENPATVP
jgi:RNA polymerase sigma-70 factor, ECF subfamily